MNKYLINGLPINICTGVYKEKPFKLQEQQCIRLCNKQYNKALIEVECPLSLEFCLLK